MYQLSSNNISDFINQSITDFIVDFESYPNKYLTEDDVRIHLCKLLLNRFDRIETTEDNDKSISLHSEVRWYGGGKLKYRSDIVLIKVNTLKVLKQSGLKMPSKGYGFNIPYAIIELKFRRPNGYSDNEFVKKINNDINKLNQIKTELSQYTKQIFCFLIALDKKKKIYRIDVGNNIHFYYKFSNVTNTNQTN